MTAHSRGVPIAGICGGYQMLGISLCDRSGAAGTSGEIAGLGLLPLHTEFLDIKQVRQVKASWQADIWTAYEIHMGVTQPIGECTLQPLLHIEQSGDRQPEGWQSDRVWGTYLHGLFESAQMRHSFVQLAQIQGYIPASISWQEHQQKLYDQMAELLEAHLDLTSICQYLQI
jgi:adenosylcobyric acid synthase